MQIQKCIVCNSSHMTQDDMKILHHLSDDLLDDETSEWIHSTGFGFLIRLNAITNPILVLKYYGISKSLRRLILAINNEYDNELIMFDPDGDIIGGYETFDW